MKQNKTDKGGKNGKKRGWNQYRFGLGGILLLFLLVCIVGRQPGVGEDAGPEDSAQSRDEALSDLEGESLEHKEDELEAHFIDVGQGDATLLIQGGHAMLIDAGGNDKGTAVQYYLMKQGIAHLDYLIGTHPDEDHIGGLDVVLYKFDVDRVFMPAVSKDTKTYRDVLDTAEAKNMRIFVPEKGDAYQLGNAVFTVLSDENKEYADVNDASICIRLTFGENSFLFCGDAGEEAEADMQKSGAVLDSDVYKVSHHGSAASGTAEFLEAVSPGTAVISCGRNNSYGHPDPDTLQRLMHIGADIYRTDEQGTVRAVSDGSGIIWSAEGGKQPEGRREPETQTDVETEDASEEGTVQAANLYILNTGTKKYHLRECGSAAQIRAENREETDRGREELEREGYTPCKRCNP